MRKRAVNNLFDKIFWYIILLLPIITYVCNFLCTRINLTEAGSMSDLFSLTSLNDFFSTNYSGFQDNVIYAAFVSFFGYFNGLNVGVFLPTFLSYCVYVEIAHIAFDFFVFIPRFCHKLVDKAVQND